MDGAPAVLFALSAFLYATGFAATLPAIRRGREGLGALCSRATVGLVAAAFFVQSAAFAAQGVTLHQCPIASRADLLEIVAWSAVAMYALSGAAVRTNLLGFFTSGLAAVLSVAALAGGPGPVFPHVAAPVLVHAWLSLFSYGAFALAALAGGMYSIQLGGLRRRRWAGIFQLLPSLRELEGVMARLLFAGFGVYTVAILVGAAWMASGDHDVSIAKLVLAMLLWMGYASAVILRRVRLLRGRRFAAAMIALFALAIVALYPIGMRHGDMAATAKEAPDAGR